jgi:hypothetical protein
MERAPYNSRGLQQKNAHPSDIKKKNRQKKKKTKEM